MARQDSHLVRRISLLQWEIPLLVGIIGAGYMIFDHFVVDSRGTASPLALAGIPFFGLVGPIFAWITLDWAAKAAAAEDRAQNETRRRALQLEAASQVGKRIAAILDVDELLNQVVALIRETFDYSHVSLFLVDADANQIVRRAGRGTSAQRDTLPLTIAVGAQGIAGRVAASGQPVLCDDVAANERDHGLELLPETRSELAVPLRSSGAVIGVLAVQSDRRGVFHKDDLVALQTLADQVAIALDNARLFRKTREQFEVMRVLHEISLDVTSRLDSQQVLASILADAARLLNAKASSLSVYDPATGSVRNVAVHNLPDEFNGVAVPLSEGVIGQVVSTGKPLIVNGYHEWDKRSAHFASSPYDTVVGVPLRWHDQVFGALDVMDLADQRSFTEQDIQVLAPFADMASIAFKNAELHAQVVKLGASLEQRVEARTQELNSAREELAHKAEQLQRLLAVTVRVQEEERERIARDLHDGSNQLVTGTLYEIHAACESLAARRTDTALKKLDKAKQLLRRIEDENRRIILDLRPPVLDVQGLVPALQWHAGVFREQCHIPCSIRVAGQPVRAPAIVETAIYRIVQESLNNVAAHAQAEHVRIGVEFAPACLTVVVEDDGVGFDQQVVRQTFPGRLGLIGMRERAESINGQIAVESLPGDGTRVTLIVPLAAAQVKVDKAEW